MTMLELVAALAIGAIVVSGGYLLLTALVDGRRRLDDAVREQEDAMNSASTIRDLIESAVIDASGVRPFVGAPEVSEFDSWCGLSLGLRERCRVTLRAQSDTGVPTLTLRTGDSLVIAMGLPAPPLSIIYQERAGRQARWIRTWGRSLSLPAALGIVLPADTLVFALSGLP